MLFFLILNIFFMVFFWKLSSQAFEEGRNTLGFTDLAVSALNGAVLLNLLAQHV